MITGSSEAAGVDDDSVSAFDTSNNNNNTTNSNSAHGAGGGGSGGLSTSQQPTATSKPNNISAAEGTAASSPPPGANPHRAAAANNNNTASSNNGAGGSSSSHVHSHNITSGGGAVPSIKHKLVLLGDPSVGKTSIITRFMYDSFEPQYQATIGIDFFLKTVRLERHEVVLHAWDTAGQERYRSLMPNYIRNSAAAVVVYDVASRASFLSAFNWVAEVRELCGAGVVVMLAGNKIDSDEREVSAAEGQRRAAEHNALWMEVSAKQGTNIKALFREVAKALPPPPALLDDNNAGAAAGGGGSGGAGQFGMSRDPFLVSPSGAGGNNNSNNSNGGRVDLSQPGGGGSGANANSGGNGCC